MLAAVWYENGTLTFTNPSMAYAIPEGSKWASQHRLLTGGSWTVPALDIAQYLQDHFTVDDFVVVKMDIEGAEFKIIPHLVKTGAIALIDEIFLECHYVGGGMVFRTSTQWSDCFKLFSLMRDNGMYAHEWF